MSDAGGIRTLETTTKKRTKVVRVLLALLAVVIAVSACTPQEITLYQTVTADVSDVLSPAQLHSLARCESTNNYSAVNPSGEYRGAYQFDQPTWNSVAERHFPWLVGQDPAAADPWWQDAQARALFSERGPQPWPEYGKKI